MPLVCPACGAYALGNLPRRADTLTCTACGTATPANILPLFVVTGASGSGKSTLAPARVCALPECVVFDSDLFWGHSREGQHHNNWLRLAYAIAQGGRHTVLCGTLMPADLDAAAERGLVGAIHFLNLHCEDAVRAARLRARPAWRQASSAAFVAEHIHFAHWLLAHAATAFTPPMPAVDTSDATPAAVADAVAAWVRGVLAGAPRPGPVCGASPA